MKVSGRRGWDTSPVVMGTATHPWAAATTMTRASWKMKTLEKNYTSSERSTSRRWYPFRPSRTESCRSCTDSSVPSKTKGRVCLPPCPEPLPFPRRRLSSPLAGRGRPRSSSGPGLTLTWITTELRTPEFSSPVVSQVANRDCPSTATRSTTPHCLLKEITVL